MVQGTLLVTGSGTKLVMAQAHTQPTRRVTAPDTPLVTVLATRPCTGPDTVPLTPPGTRLPMRLPPAVFATVPRATTAALMASLLLLVLAAAAPVANTTPAKAALTVIPVLAASIKTRAHKLAARPVQR